MACTCCQNKPRPIWEYQTVPMPVAVEVDQRYSQNNVEILLDKFGWDGWELCGTIRGYFLLKRQRVQQ